MCAILPKSARSNIVVVFTNTSNPLYLSFDIDALSKFVEHTVPPEKQIFFENPFVLWERSMKHQGHVDQTAMHTELAKAFRDSADNLAKFLVAVAKMGALNTDEFEALYMLRQKIESETVSLLNEMEASQQEVKRLAQQQREFEHAKTDQELNKTFTKTFCGSRWVFKDAPRHGTFCGVRGCHSNCHAPCLMDKTMAAERLRSCTAFFYKKKHVTLRNESDREELLRHMYDTQTEFVVGDGCTSCGISTVLRSTSAFHFLGHDFVKGALVSIPGACGINGYSAAQHLRDVKMFPSEVCIRDKSDQDTCNECGHHRKYHYHDEKVWEEEDYTEEVIDEATKLKYEAAKDLAGKQAAAINIIKANIRERENKQSDLGQKLLANVRRFEQSGLSRNYAMLLQNQKDLLDSHIESTLEGDHNADVSALRKARDELEKQWQVVVDQLKNKADAPLDWACAMMGVRKAATWEEVEKAFREESFRLHPDKFGGNPERMQQLNEAHAILKKHLVGTTISLFGRVAQFFGGGGSAGSA